MMIKRIDGDKLYVDNLKLSLKKAGKQNNQRQDKATLGKKLLAQFGLKNDFLSKAAQSRMKVAEAHLAEGGLEIIFANTKNEAQRVSGMLAVTEGEPIHSKTIQNFLATCRSRLSPQGADVNGAPKEVARATLG